MIRLNVSIEEFTTDIRMIVIGNVFEWCVRSGKVDFEGNMSRLLGKYLDSTLCPGDGNDLKRSGGVHRGGENPRDHRIAEELRKIC